MKCNPETLTLSPKSTGVVRVTVSTGSSAAGDLWFALLIHPEGVRGLIDQQILGVASIARSLHPDLELVSKGFQKSQQGIPLALNFRMHNKGNSGIKPVSNAGVLDGKGKLVAELQMPQSTNAGIIPGAFLDGTVMLPPSLPEGKYTVKVQTRFGPKSIAVLSLPYTVKIAGPVTPNLPPRPGK